MLIRMRFFKDISICSFCIDNNLVVPASISDNNTHPLPTAEGDHFHQFKHHLFLLKLQFNKIFCLLHKAIPNSLCIVYKAHFIRTRTLKLVFYLVLYYIMADNETKPKLIEVRFFSVSLQVFFKVLSCNYRILKYHLLENHLVCSKSPRFISQYTVNHSKLLNY